MWECEFKKMKETNPELREMIRNHPLLSRATIEPRHALAGGRVENFVVKYEAKEGEAISYCDFTSMYPFLLKTSKFITGHPVVYTGGQCRDLTGDNLNNLSRVEGLVKCSVLAPRNLYLPVLGFKSHGRLIFALCRTCMDKARKSDCDHENIDDRKFEGVFVVNELRKAVGWLSDFGHLWQYSFGSTK